MYELQTFNSPILKQVCRDVAPDENVDKLVLAMRDTMRDYRDVGLAAPQVGSDLRVIIVSGGRSEPTVMVNPVLLKASVGDSEDTEGCLSFPGVQAKVRRPSKVEVQFEEWPHRRVQRWKLRHFEARVFQHELDHLNGICRVGEAWNGELPGLPVSRPAPQPGPDDFVIITNDEPDPATARRPVLRGGRNARMGMLAAAALLGMGYGR